MKIADGEIDWAEVSPNGGASSEAMLPWKVYLKGPSLFLWMVRSLVGISGFFLFLANSGSLLKLLVETLLSVLSSHIFIDTVFLIH